MVRCRQFWNFVAVAVLLVFPCSAQQDNASMVVSLTDQSGALVASARVVAEHITTSRVTDFAPDGHGNYLAPVLPIGKYRVRVTAAGFDTTVLEDIPLSVADRVRLTVTLKPGVVQQVVTVTGTAPLVDTASTTLGAVINAQQVSQLPLNGRDIAGLLAMVPGVSLQSGNAQRNVGGQGIGGGARGSGIHFLLDGADASRVDSDSIDNSYSASQGRITRSSVDSVEEVRVNLNSFSAEYGNALGGVINLITKSGTNAFHGSAFEYFRNEVLDTRDYFNVSPELKPPLRLNQFGGAVGGPIRHDRLFFFANYEAVRQRTGAILNTYVPTQAFRSTLPPVLQPVVDMLPLPNGPVSLAVPQLAQYSEAVSNLLDEDSGSAKLDYYVSPKDRISGRYYGNGSLTSTHFGVAQGQIQPTPALNQFAKITYTRTVSPTLLNELGFAVNRIHIDPRASNDPAILTFPKVSLGNGSAGVGPYSNDLLVANNSFTWADTLSWVTGRNQFK